MVKFLQGNNTGGKPGIKVPIDGEAVSALVISYTEMSYEWYAEKEISAMLFGDNGQGDPGIVFETIRFADEVVFILLKAISFHNRNEPKDAADLIYVMRYAGEPEDIAEKFLDRIKSGKHQTATETGLNALQKCFAEGNYNVEGYLLTGPVRYGQFMHGTDANLENERLQEQRFAAALVTEVLRLINEGRDETQ